MQLLDGKQLSLDIQKELSEIILKRKNEGKVIPHLAAVLVGNNPASESYIGNKVKTCEKIGFRSTLKKFDESVSEKELLELIDEWNRNHDIHGMLIQLPLPPHIDVEKITNAIWPEKDVDGFHPENIGKMVKNLPCHISATPLGILLLLEHYKIETSRKHCVVIGRSDIVGKPMSILMSRNNYPGNCTVTLCHSKTLDIKSICKTADILIAAIGKPSFVSEDMIKEGAVVIDVGINRVNDDKATSGYKLTGDVDFAKVAPLTSYITPVPGGVGPMTIVALLKNTMNAMEMIADKNKQA